MNNKSILLVDDDETILNTLGLVIQQADYYVKQATSAEEAIQYMKARLFDLVITDLSMPGLGGIAVLKEAKKINSLTGVIILTGHGDLNSAIDALRLGADDYIQKPCGTTELLIRTERFLEKQEALKKIKVYENILSVCTYCKKIKDEASPEEEPKWLKLEAYVRKTSNIQTSHGLCPECFEKKMKELDEEDMEQG